MQKKQQKAPETKPYKTAPRGHRRMSSVSAGALLAELMHVPVDEHDPPAPVPAAVPPMTERKVIGRYTEISFLAYPVKALASQDDA